MINNQHIKEGGTNMTLLLKDLKAGVAYWQKESNWPKDFHNNFYRCMSESKIEYMPHDDFNDEWWKQFLKCLVSWKAIRPRSKEYITINMKEHKTELMATWEECIIPNIEKDIAQVEWRQVSQFVDTVAKIKNVSSPVFTSKFCHFLAPQLFPVVDNAAMGNPFSSYRLYYDCARGGWMATETATQKELQAFLRKKIGTGVYRHYPYKCKIVELCLIGKHKKRNANAMKVV